MLCIQISDVPTWQFVYSIVQFDLGLCSKPSFTVASFKEYSDDKDNPLATLTWTPFVLVNIYFLPSKLSPQNTKVFGRKSTVVKWNYWIFCLHPLTVHQKMPSLDFQNELSKSKTIRILSDFFPLKNNCLGEHFL